VRAGTPAAAGSVLSGGGVAGAVSGTTATIALSVGDRFGNAVAGEGTFSGVVPNVVFTPSAGSVALTPTVGMTDNGDGTFLLKYTVSSGSSSTTSAVAGITVAGELVSSGCDTTGAAGTGCTVTVAVAGATDTLVLSAAKTTADGPGLFYGEAGWAKCIVPATSSSTPHSPYCTPSLYYRIDCNHMTININLTL